MKAPLLIIGAGGHARSVLDIALQNDEYSNITCVDPSYPKSKHVEGMKEVPIIGTDADLPDLISRGFKYAFVALGENKLRHKLFNEIIRHGYETINIISKHAIISPRAKLGSGICVMAGAVINTNTIIENNCIINTRASIDHDCRVSESCHIAPGATVSGYVNIGKYTLLGTGTSVKDKLTIGENCVIGAGSLVIKDLAPNNMYYGVPAKPR